MTWMEDSVCFQNCPLSSWSGGKVFKKGSQALKKQNKTKKQKKKKHSVFIKLLPWPRAGTPPKTL